MAENWKADDDGILISVRHSLSSHLVLLTDSIDIDFILCCCRIVDLSVDSGYPTEPTGHLQLLPREHTVGPVIRFRCDHMRFSHGPARKTHVSVCKIILAIIDILSACLSTLTILSHVGHLSKSFLLSMTMYPRCNANPKPRSLVGVPWSITSPVSYRHPLQLQLFVLPFADSTRIKHT